MKRKTLLVTAQLLFASARLFAAGSYDEIFAPLMQIQNILKYLGSIVLILSLVAQGIIVFFSDNIPDIVKKTVGKAATGGCFIGGASAIAGFILPSGVSAGLAPLLNHAA